MNYQRAYIFSKYTDMLTYFNANKDRICGVPMFEDHDAYQKRVDNIRKRYAKERPVSLILLVRYEKDHSTNHVHTICKIKCPINPLPIKGEFEASSLQSVIDSIIANGWEQVTTQTKFNLRLFE